MDIQQIESKYKEIKEIYDKELKQYGVKMPKIL